VERFINPLLEQATAKIRSTEGDRDPKSELQEWAQGNGFGAPYYKIVAESGPDHSKDFVVEVQVEGKPLGRGEGRSKQAASKAAARQALQRMENGTL
jgi:ribonuclease-3